MSTHWPYPYWFAHRGAGRQAPENTLAAFRLGAQHGWRAFECDVKLSADGVPFLLHDNTLERTTGGHGVAGDRAWHDLSRLDAGSWHGRNYAGEPLATLEAVSRFMRRNGFALNIELKPTIGLERETGEAVADSAALWWAGDATPPLLSSFSVDALLGAQKLAPKLPRALLLEDWHEGWMEQALSLGCVAVVAHHPLWNANTIAAVRRQGQRTLAYTVNELAEARRLQQAGIDGLITDEVTRFAPAYAGVRA
jgi:glycerophosphoryl diester phosphodiesterase